MPPIGVPEELRARVRALEGGGGAPHRGAAPLGAALDAGLPWHGLPYGSLHEVSGRAATAAVAAFASRFLQRRGGALVWCHDPRLAAELGELYGPGLARFGLTPERVIVVRCRAAGEVAWASAEALRCRGVACAVAEIGPRLDLLTSRRLQLAAEAGGGVGLLLRPELDLSPNAALTRWRAEPSPGADGLCWRLILWRVKGGAPGSWTVRWDEQALAFALAPGMADRTVAAPAAPRPGSLPAG
jgi:protein ImuA